jgi:uncharacterized protein
MEKKIISHVAHICKEKLSGEGSGHDWLHIYRVWNMSCFLAQAEGIQSYVIELAALLHDIADHKFNNGDCSIGPQIAHKILEECNVSPTVIKHVTNIIEHISFKGALVKDSVMSIEGKIVQDADRLDAIGAIGIARTFAYGGYKKRLLYDPTVHPQLHKSFEEYSANASSSINHFYEKLLLLKDRMHTETAKKIAQERHAFMELYLQTFFNECEI